MTFLSSQAQHMEAEGLCCLAQLADHLGLSGLLDIAAEQLIQMPWHKNMPLLSDLLKLSVYMTDTDKRTKLLHHQNVGPAQSYRSWLCLKTSAFPELTVPLH